MNLWDLKSITAIFNVSSSRTSQQGGTYGQGFCACQPSETHSHEPSPGESAAVQLPQSNPDEPLRFIDLAKIRPKKLSTIVTQRQDQSWLDSSSKPLPCRKKGRRTTRNLKSIASRVYEHLKRHGTSSHEELINSVFACLANASHEKEEGKNIRRRLYDAINVMVALKVFKKCKNRIMFDVNYPNSNEQNQSDFNAQQLNRELSEINQSLNCKRKILKRLKQIENYLHLLTKRNQKNSNTTERLMFPISICEEDKIISLLKENKEKVTIFYPTKNIQLNSESEILEHLINGQKNKQKMCQ